MVYLLIAIALFAALGYAVSQSMRGGDPTLVSTERVKVLASDLLDYGRNVRQAVQTIRINNGCTETEISFEANGLAGYVHTPTVARDACKIFNMAGGRMNYVPPTQDVSSNDWLLTGSTVIDQVGTTAPDLTLILRDIPLSVCQYINDQMNIPAPVADTTVSFTPFTSTYASTATLEAADGFPAGCQGFDDGSTTTYFFYQVVLSR